MKSVITTVFLESTPQKCKLQSITYLKQTLFQIYVKLVNGETLPKYLQILHFADVLFCHLTPSPPVCIRFWQPPSPSGAESFVAAPYW